QTSPRFQISSASLAIFFTFSVKRLCVSATTKIRNVSFGFSGFIIPGKGQSESSGQNRTHAHPPGPQFQIATGAIFPNRARDDQLWVKVAASVMGPIMVMERGLSGPE